MDQFTSPPCLGGCLPATSCGPLANWCLWVPVGDAGRLGCREHKTWQEQPGPRPTTLSSHYGPSSETELWKSHENTPLPPSMMTERGSCPAAPSFIPGRWPLFNNYMAHASLTHRKHTFGFTWSFLLTVPFLCGHNNCSFCGC